jgi:hypothetical protein
MKCIEYGKIQCISFSGVELTTDSTWDFFPRIRMVLFLFKWWFYSMLHDNSTNNLTKKCLIIGFCMMVTHHISTNRKLEPIINFYIDCYLILFSLF